MRDIKNRPFGARDKVGYMFGDFGCNMSFQLIGSYLSLFLTQGMGLTLVDWTIIVIVAKVFDAINDPIIGAMVDAFKPRKSGKFRPWIFWSSFAIAITTTLLFVDISSFSHAGKFAYALIMYMLWSIAYTAANVPYGSLNAALTDDLEQRSNLSSFRSIGAGLAMLPIMIVVPMLAFEKDSEQLKPDVFVWIALGCGIIGIIGFMLTYFLTHERQIVNKPKAKFSYKKTLKAFLHNKPVIALSIVSLLQIVFILTYSTTMPIVFQVYFKNTEILSVAPIIAMLPMLVLIPFVGKLTVKFGKKEISTWPCLFAILILFIMIFIPYDRSEAGAWVYTIMFSLSMFGGGAFTLATWSMVADCVDQQEINTGIREEGSVYATYSFVRKVAQGVGLGIIPLCLGAVGYNPDNIAESQIFENANGILRLSILFPLIGFILIFFVMLFMYNLSKKKVNENAVILKELHKELYVEEGAEATAIETVNNEENVVVDSVDMVEDKKEEVKEEEETDGNDVASVEENIETVDTDVTATDTNDVASVEEDSKSVANVDDNTTTTDATEQEEKQDK